MDPQASPNPIDPKPPNLSPDSSPKWPCKSTPKRPPANDSGWPTKWDPPKNPPRILTPEELSRLADDQAQQSAVIEVTKFLTNTDIADDEDEEVYDNEDDEYAGAIEYEGGDIEVILEEEDRVRREFFEKLFVEDSVLMEYYKRNCGGGEFRCLVCYAVREKGWKRFKGGTALVLHSLSIAKTRRRKAHRAYAEAICNLFGWDINKLIQSSDKSAEAKGKVDNCCKDVLNVPEGNVDVVKVDAGEVPVQKKSTDNGNENDKSDGGAEHNPLAEDDTSRCVEVPKSPLKDAESANAECSPNGLHYDPISSTKTEIGGAPELSPDSGTKWPCKPSPKRPPVDDSGWPTAWDPPKNPPRVLTPEELSRLADDQAQQAAVVEVTKFLSNTDIADDDDEEEYDEYAGAIVYENGDIDEILEEEDRVRHEFFEKLFVEDSVLMEYYKKNCGGGEFRCLVCYAVREKGWKRFKGCTALVLHSLSIAKTRRRKAHRAYAEAICNLFGWDINKLIQSSDKSAEAQSNIDNCCKDGLKHPEGNVDLVKVDAGEVPVEKKSTDNGNENNKSDSVSEHNPLAEDDTSKCGGVPKSGLKDGESVNAEDSPNALEPAKLGCDDACAKGNEDDKEDNIQN